MPNKDQYARIDDPITLERIQAVKFCRPTPQEIYDAEEYLKKEGN